MRFLVVLSLITLTACAKNSGNDASNSDSNEINYTAPSPDSTQPNFGTVGNGGSVIELPDGVVMADSYYEAPTYKVPSFYFGRVEDFDKVFPGVRDEMKEITRLLNMRYGGVEVVRFNPEKFEIYLSNKFSGEHAMAVTEGHISSQVAYTFSFRSLSADLTSEVVHNVIEISPEIKSWPVRIQALILMHEISHHHPRLGMAEHFHSLIAPMIEGAELLMKIRDRQFLARAEGRQDTLQTGEYEKLVLMDRALFYMLKGRLSEGDIEYLPITCESAFSVPCPPKWESSHLAKLSVRIVDKKGGGVFSIPVDNTKIGNKWTLDSIDYWDDPSIRRSEFHQELPQREDAQSQIVLSAYYAKTLAKFESNYASVDSYISINWDEYPVERPHFVSGGTREDEAQTIKKQNEFEKNKAKWKAKAFDGLNRNVFESVYLRLNLGGYDCARNLFRNLSQNPPSEWNWKPVTFEEVYIRPRPYNMYCPGGTDNHVEDMVLASDYMAPIYLKGYGNKISSVSATAPLFVNGKNSVIENSSLSTPKSKDGKPIHAIGIMIESDVVVKGSVIADGTISNDTTTLWYFHSSNRAPREAAVLINGFKSEGVLYRGSLEPSILLSTLTQIPAHRLGLVEIASFNEDTEESLAIEPWFLTDYAAGETCGSSRGLISRKRLRESRVAALKKWTMRQVPCMAYQFQALDKVIPAEALR